MKKLILIPESINQINETMDCLDGYILGLNQLSTNFSSTFSLEEILEISKKIGKEIFVSINKNMHNQDLQLLESTLLELDKTDINGIIFYDIAVINIHKRLNLHIPLVWNQEHFVTNSSTINYWYKEGAKYAYLSSEITLEEIEKIRKETSSSLFMNIFGYIPIFTSKRHLVNNYLNYFSLKDESNVNYMEKEGSIYPIIEKELTTIYSKNILDGLKEYLSVDIDYVVINSFNIENAKMLEVVKMFSSVNSTNINEYSLRLNEMFPNLDKGFFYVETVYKVIK